jgi:hypothetical protein
MSNANAKISRPSQAYSQATGSLVYRLSELTFGSLLAAYSLGFVGAIAAHWNDLFSHGNWGILLLSVQYASISITFAYLTTSFYLTYHAGILTMPQMPLYDLRVDFTLAIVQAVIFGFSLLRPWSFSILLALNFYVTGYRQRREYDELAKFLYDRICNIERRPNLDQFSASLQKHLREDFSELSSWGPIPRIIWGLATVMLILGFLIGYLVVELPFNSDPLGLSPTWTKEQIWIYKQSLVTFEVLLVAVGITIYGWRVLKRRARFLVNPSKGASDDQEEKLAVIIDTPDSRQKNKKLADIDVQFDCLQRKLEKLCPG